MENDCEPGRFKRGDTSQDRPGLVFIRYKRGQEQWGTPEILEKKKVQGRIANAKQRKKPGHKKMMREYFATYNHLPKQKKYHAEYYRRPDVLERYREREFNKPERIARREARAKWRAERAAYRESEEYKEKLRADARDYYARNKPIINAKKTERCRNNPEMRLKQNVAGMIRQAMKSQKIRKNSRTESILGCTMAEFKAHIEKQFEPDMTWENMGAWEIDHRTPLSSFNLVDPFQMKTAFGFNNCRPMWKPDNRKKSDKIEGTNLRGRDLRKANIIPFEERVA